MRTARPEKELSLGVRSCVVLATVSLAVASVVSATVVIPPRNLGELAVGSTANVVAVAGRSRVEARGERLVTVTEFAVTKAISGPLLAGDAFVVTAPGGETEDRGWLVPGSPRFADGATYMLFLIPDGHGGWLPRLLAYGVLGQVTGTGGEVLLEPVPEAGEMVSWQRPDGETAERLGVYRQDRLIGLLGRVTRGEARWDAEEVLASPSELPLRPRAQGLEYGCPMIGEDTGYGVRWDRFDDGKTVSVYSESRGEPDLGEDGGHRQLREAVETWMAVGGTNIKLSYGGRKSYSLPCSSGFDAPASSANVVVFNDPCSDLGSMDGCSGIAAYGGPWYSGSHTFNSRKWRTAVGLYMVVNDGASCVGPDMYRRLLAHELGHMLGFSHSADTGSLMYKYCCNKMNDTDEACARYVYPGSNPGAPPSPEGVTASDGTVAGAVTVTWQASAGAVGYEVWRSQGGSIVKAQPLGEATGLSLVDSAASAGVPYQYWVRARSATALGEFGQPDTGFAGCTSVAGPEVTAPTSVVSGESYAIRWQQLPGATNYVVEESSSADFAAVLRQTVDATSAPFQHAVSGPSSFYYRVRPQVPCGGGEAPAEFSEVALVTVVPAAGASGVEHVRYVAGVARAAGAGGESWRTDLELRNSGETVLAATIELLRLNEENPTPVSKSVTIEPGRTQIYEDVLGSLFGSSGAGALRLRTGSDDLIVSARTYNQTSSGSYGQFIPSFDDSDVLTAGRPGRLVQLAHALARDHGRRTNVGLINEGASRTRVEVRLFAASGELLGKHTAELGGYGAVQLNDVFAGLTDADLAGAYAVVVPDGSGRVIAYASIIDNRTGDPEFVRAR